MIVARHRRAAPREVAPIIADAWPGRPARGAQRDVDRMLILWHYKCQYSAVAESFDAGIADARGALHRPRRLFLRAALPDRHRWRRHGIAHPLYRRGAPRCTAGAADAKRCNINTTPSPPDK